MSSESEDSRDADPRQIDAVNLIRFRRVEISLLSGNLLGVLLMLRSGTIYSVKQKIKQRAGHQIFHQTLLWRDATQENGASVGVWPGPLQLMLVVHPCVPAINEVLLTAAFLGDYDATLLALQARADVECRCPNGESALLKAFTVAYCLCHCRIYITTVAVTCFCHCRITITIATVTVTVIVTYCHYCYVSTAVTVTVIVSESHY